MDPGPPRASARGGYRWTMPHRSDDLRRLEGHMDRLVMELWGGGRGPSTFRPAVDVYVAGQPPVLTVELELAGIAVGDVDVVVEGDVVAIRGVRRPPANERRAYQHAEIEWGRFERRVQLPDRVDVDAARADCRDGLLSISMPLAPAPQPARRSIVVRTERDPG